jgi:hypothetical protein
VVPEVLEDVIERPNLVDRFRHFSCLGIRRVERRLGEAQPDVFDLGFLIRGERLRCLLLGS